MHASADIRHQQEFDDPGAGELGGQYVTRYTHVQTVQVLDELEVIVPGDSDIPVQLCEDLIGIVAAGREVLDGPLL